MRLIVESIKKLLGRFLIGCARSIVLVIDHGLWGGATIYIYAQTAKLSRGELAVVISPGRVAFACGGRKKPLFGFAADSLRIIPRVTKKLSKIVVNELVEWDLKLIMRQILGLKKRTGVPMIFMLHDYYCVCPRYTLTFKGVEYCNSEVSLSRCADCLPECDVRAWREDWRTFLAACDEIRAFSRDTKTRFERCFPNLKATVVPHQLPRHFAERLSLDYSKLVIGFVGHCSLTKGRDKFLELAKYVQRERPDVSFEIVGPLADYSQPVPSNVHIHGGYCAEELTCILREAGVNMIFFPSLWPETFSFVTSEIIELGLPIVCYNIGAPAERVAAYEKGRVIPGFDVEDTWATIKTLYGNLSKEWLLDRQKEG